MLLVFKLLPNCLFIFTVLIKSDLKRQAANKSNKESENREVSQHSQYNGNLVLIIVPGFTNLLTDCIFFVSWIDLFLFEYSVISFTISDYFHSNFLSILRYLWKRESRFRCDILQHISSIFCLELSK